MVALRWHAVMKSKPSCQWLQQLQQKHTHSYQLQLQDCWGPSRKSRWIPWNIFFKYRDFHPFLWKGVSACTACLFNSQATKRGSGAKVAVSLGVHQKETLWGFGPAAPNVVTLLLKTNGLSKVFLRCYLDSLSFRCSTVTLALLEGSTWVFITRC